MKTELKGQTALVTGASRGIGAAIAHRLAKSGAHVIAHYGAGAAETEAVVRAIRDAGGSAEAVQADLSKADGAEVLATRVKAPRIDILVNNAGVAPFASLLETTPQVFDELMNINAKNLFFITQWVAKRMPEGGRIINISSAVTRTSFANLSAYAASKGFVDVVTLQWAQELGSRRITVNAVAPGAIDTRMSAWIHGPGGKENLAQMQALPGIGQPEHVAAMVSYLAGPDGAWTTGQVLDVSGGTKL
jgi:3-oxoacyl-[acyl-carrier protein] reductase